MASLVGFMFLDRQNVVADRDIQTPMGQMENAHSHEGQSVVRGGQVVFQRKLAIATAQIVYPIYLIVIQLPAKRTSNSRISCALNAGSRMAFR